MAFAKTVTSGDPTRDAKDFEGSDTRNASGKKHLKARHAYNSNRAAGPQQSAALKGLKAAAQSNPSPIV